MGVEISVTLITYNQEKYIEKAIKSVLEQEVDCRFELIIVDDCSSDSTYKICERFYNQYKDIIRLYKNEQNVGATRNQLIACKKCQGKYICHLEGDDYWSDKHKLQKQYTFLNQHSEYVGVGHKVRVIDDNEREIFISPKKYKEIIYIQDFLRGYLFSGTSLMYRNYFDSIDAGYERMATFKRNVGDFNYKMYLMHLGPIFQMQDVMLNYRAYQPNNFNHVVSKAKSSLMHLEIYDELDRYFNFQYDLNRFRVESIIICYLSRFLGDKSSKNDAKDVYKKAKCLVSKKILIKAYLSLPIYVIKNLPLFILKRRKLR